MGLREFFNLKPKSDESESDAQFSSSTFPVPDGLPYRHDDPRIAYLFNPAGVTREAALKIPTVARGMSMLTNLANLSLVTFRGNKETRTNVLLAQIDPELPNVVTMARTIEDLVFEGVAYWQVLLVNKSTGYPTKARHLPAQMMTEKDGEYWFNSEQLDPTTVIKFTSPRQPLLPAISQTVRQALALGKTSEMYANNPVPKIIFTPAEGVDPDPEKTTQAIQGFADSAQDSPVAYIGAALDATVISALSPADMQLIEQDKATMLKIANFFDMDPSELGIDVSSRTYKNAVERRIDRKNDQLMWLALSIEQRLSLGDVTPAGYYVKFDFSDFLRADPLERAQIAQIEIGFGGTTVDEYRAGKDLPPLTPEQKAEVVPRVQASFSGDTETSFAFEAAEFSDLNAEKRTVKVLAVPYGEVARKNGKKFVFQKGSIQWPEPLSKVKLLRDHDYSQSVGYATSVEDTDKGLVVSFKVAPGPDGDRAIAGFVDGNYDAASIGVDFDEDGLYTDRATPGVYQVRSARLKEISQVSIPAFENARVLSVQAASDKEGTNMSDNTAGVATEAPEKTYTVAEFQAMQNAFNKPSVAPASVQDDTNVAPRELKANAQEKAVTSVNEPGPYRFDGREGARFEFSTDFINAYKGNGGARERVNEFMAEQFAVSVANAATLNPTIQRPDMYVGQLDYRYPIWNRINKGAPPNGVSSFAFPKYSSSSTLVADHVEGTEPTLGTWVATNQTVTPTALSGKIEINREAWDQGGNPALSQVIRDDMVRAYNEGLETAAATFLDAQSFTTTTITLGVADAALEGEMIDALVGLQVVRGGYLLDNLVVQIDLYKALVKAKDTAGRRLFPAFNPMNATGNVTSGFSSLNINGLVGSPAWALGASGTVLEKSYLFDASKVHGWATPPRIDTYDIQVKSVYLGLFGYKAFAVSDTNGVRTLAYDPV